MTQSLRCTTCNGKGKVRDYIAGSGVRLCYQCNGKGIVPAPQRFDFPEEPLSGEEKERAWPCSGRTVSQ